MSAQAVRPKTRFEAWPPGLRRTMTGAADALVLMVCWSVPLLFGASDHGWLFSDGGDGAWFAAGAFAVLALRHITDPHFETLKSTAAVAGTVFFALFPLAWGQLSNVEADFDAVSLPSAVGHMVAWGLIAWAGLVAALAIVAVSTFPATGRRMDGVNRGTRASLAGLGGLRPLLVAVYLFTVIRTFSSYQEMADVFRLLLLSLAAYLVVDDSRIVKAAGRFPRRRAAKEPAGEVNYRVVSLRGDRALVADRVAGTGPHASSGTLGTTGQQVEIVELPTGGAERVAIVGAPPEARLLPMLSIAQSGAGTTADRTIGWVCEGTCERDLVLRLDGGLSADGRLPLGAVVATPTTESEGTGQEWTIRSLEQTVDNAGATLRAHAAPISAKPDQDWVVPRMGSGVELVEARPRHRLIWDASGEPVCSGSATCHEVRLSAKELTSRGLLVLGAPGSGKTVFGMSLIASLLASDKTVRAIVIDPTGDWRNVLSGRLGIDAPNVHGKAEAVLTTMADPDAQLCFFEPDGHEIDDLNKIATACVSRAKSDKDSRRILFVVDEALLTMAQPGGNHAGGKSLVAAFAQGRKYGIAPVVFSQRSVNLGGGILDLVGSVVTLKTAESKAPDVAESLAGSPAPISPANLRTFPASAGDGLQIEMCIGGVIVGGAHHFVRASFELPTVTSGVPAVPLPPDLGLCPI